MLGHRADERGYEVAGAILRDLGLGAGDGMSRGVRILTNNPDKVEALRREGLRIVERVAMVPRSWQMKRFETPIENASDRRSNATMIGGNTINGDDLDKYLRTKVTKMGHLLEMDI